MSKMDISQKLTALSKGGRYLDRTAFKVVFFLALTAKPQTLTVLVERTGIQAKSIADALKGLGWDGLTREEPDGYVWACETIVEFIERARARRDKQIVRADAVKKELQTPNVANATRPTGESI